MDRRLFMKSVIGGTALSITALDRLNASVYAHIAELNKDAGDSPGDAYWDAVRKHFLFEDRLIMMNNGTLGPMPEPVFNKPPVPSPRIGLAYARSLVICSKPRAPSLAVAMEAVPRLAAS